MSSRKRKKANKTNAQKSTGPKSIEGKEIASMNAATHCLTSKKVIVDGEDPKEYQAFERAMRNDMAPVGAFEEELARRYIEGAWRLRRVHRYERELLEQVEDPIGKGQQLALVCRYEREIRRGMEKDLTELRHTQRNRVFDRITKTRDTRLAQAKGKGINTQDLDQQAYDVMRRTMSTREMIKLLDQPLSSDHLGFVSSNFPISPSHPRGATLSYHPIGTLNEQRHPSPCFT